MKMVTVTKVETSQIDRTDKAQAMRVIENRRRSGEGFLVADIIASCPSVKRASRYGACDPPFRIAAGQACRLRCWDFFGRSA